MVLAGNESTAPVRAPTWLLQDFRTVKAVWEDAYRTYSATDSPERREASLAIFHDAGDRVRDALQQAVRRLGGESLVAAAALNPIYSEWVPAPADNTAPVLTSESAQIISAIENRLARCLHRQNQHSAERDSYQRQAWLLDWVPPSRERSHAMDRLMESLLENDLETFLSPLTAQPVSHTWQELRRRWSALINLPLLEEIDRLHQMSGADLSQASAHVNQRIAAAVASAPPRLYRRSQTVEAGAARVQVAAAAHAARRAAFFYKRLSNWAAFIPANEAWINGSRGELLAALSDWLDRSTPFEFVFDSNQRHFSRWYQHVMRASQLGAATWRTEWFRDQAAEAIALGRAAIASPSARAGEVAQFAYLCITAAQAGCATPRGESDDWYLTEAERCARSLDEIQAAGINERLVSFRDPPRGGRALAEKLPNWLNGDFRDEPDRATARQTFLQTASDECPLVRLLSERALSFLDNEAPKFTSQWVAGDLILEVDQLVDLVIDQAHRASWLNDDEGPVSTAGIDDLTDVATLLSEMDLAVRRFLRQSDPAIPIAAARLYLRHRKHEQAATQVWKAIECDKRPKSLSICRELLAEIDLQRNPTSAAGRLRAYRDLEEAYAIGASDHVAKSKSLSPLIRAFSLARKSGWNWEAARCLRKIRISKLDRKNAVAENHRIENIASWYARRPEPQKRTRDRLFQLLLSAAAGLERLQSERLPDSEIDALETARQTVATVAAVLPSSHVVPELIAKTRINRLHALAVALHRHGRLAISDQVKNSALRRLDDADAAVTFIAAWLVARYFDSPNFGFVLRTTLREMKDRRYGAKALKRLRDELPKAMAEEIAARSATLIARAGAVSRPSVEGMIADLNELMDNALVQKLNPKGYGGQGALLLDDAALRRAFGFATTLIVDAPRRGLWLEATRATRTLAAFREGLDTKSARRLGVLVPLTQAYNVEVQLTRGGALRFVGLMRKQAHVPDITWRNATKTLRARLTHVIAQLQPKHRQWAQSSVRQGADSIAIEVSAQLIEPPEIGDYPSDADWINAKLDQLFGVHLGRLTGCAAGDLLGDLTPFLHRAKSSLQTITQDSRENGLVALATLHIEAGAAWQAIKQPPRENTRSLNIDDILRTSLSHLSLTSQFAGADIRGVPVRMPEQHLRLLLEAILSNASKSISTAVAPNPSVRLEAQLTDSSLHLQISTPFARFYPKGAGRGIAGAEAYLNYWGGRLSESRRHDTWSVRLQLPLARAGHEELGWR
jgi:hypothetical protein